VEEQVFNPVNANVCKLGSKLGAYTTQLRYWISSYSRH
jgi:transposase-like protein